MVWCPGLVVPVKDRVPDNETDDDDSYDGHGDDDEADDTCS